MSNVTDAWDHVQTTGHTLVGVDGGVLRLISPYIPVRLESAPTGSAVHATPAGDDASQTTVHTPLHSLPYTLNPIPFGVRGATC